MKQPVSEGQELRAKIESLGDKGDGIVKVNGFVVFVKGAEVDKTYDLRIIRVGSKFGRAEIVTKD